MKKKILVILHLPPPVHGASVVGQYIKQSELINNAYNCDYINLSTSRNLSEIGKGGYRKFFIFCRLCVKTFLAVLKNRYSLCYITVSTKGFGYYKDFLIILILKLFGAKIVYHFHNKGIMDKSDKYFPNLLYRFQFRNTRAILLSPCLFPDVAKYLPEEKVHYCPNGIPEISGLNQNLINKKRAAKSIPEILFLSNMMKEKGVYTLLEACRLLNNKGIKFNMIFVGAWVNISESEFTEFLLINNLQGNVFYGGKKYGIDKSAYFENADIFILPTLNDCFPLVLLEAMQYGIPIISTKEGGIPDIVSENETGYLVEKQNVKELAYKIQNLVENPGLRRKMGAASKKKFDELFRIDLFENNFIKILNTVIRENA